MVKNPLNADYSAAPKKIETNPKAPKSSSWVRTFNRKDIFSKGCTKYLSKEILVIESVLKTHSWMCKIKGLTGGKIIRVCYEK